MRALLLVSLWVICAIARSPGLVVPTQQGEVQGTLVADSVRRFLGIPYASAGRWTAPKFPARRDHLFTADRFGDSCIQQFTRTDSEGMELTGFLSPNVTESEDCLSVNIWAPSVTRRQNTAVMIWIYGGGLRFGTVSREHLPSAEGSTLLSEQLSNIRWSVHRAG